MESYIWQFIINWSGFAVGWLFWVHYQIIDIETYFTISLSELISLFALVALISLCGFNFTLWGTVGLLRLLQEKISRTNFRFNNKNYVLKSKSEICFTKYNTAIIVPAHNEEMVIAKTIMSLLPLVPRANIFVISDGSIDKTAQIARGFDVNVLELDPARGKAGALQAGINHFELAENFKAVVFVDADTVLPENYLDKALPFFNDNEVVAIAGYARTIWNPAKQSLGQIYFIAHREIVYTLSQLLLKFGQSWKFANVVTIIPGFASIYRSCVLDKIDLNPPGLVIEDFNMTFEVHHKKLGRIVHVPTVSGYTQDPDNLHDYFRQVKRWDLGFWQTIKYHGLWPSKFSVFLALFVGEVILSSIFLVLAPFLLFILLELSFIPDIHAQMSIWLSLFVKISILSIWIPNIIASIVVGVIQRRHQYFIYAPFFIFLKFLDSVALLFMLYKAFMTHSTGRWVSPSRRAN